MALTKAGLIQSIADQTGFSKCRSSDFVEFLLESLKSKLESGEDILISGFGKFCVKELSQRKGRNPVTGEDMMLRPHRVVRFKCSGKLRNKIS